MLVLITGTSRGIGKELLQLYASRNVSVLALDIVDDPEFIELYPNAMFRLVDISKESEVEDVVSFMFESNIVPDVFIFNAAVHDTDNEPFIDYALFRKVIEIDLMSTLKFISCLMPRLNKPTTFVYCSSGVVIFPNPSSLGYFLGKLAVTRVFDIFSYRYAGCGFRFKSVILGPIASNMLRDSRKPPGIVGFLRDMTTGTPKIAAAKIIKFIDNPRRRMYYRRLSAVLLWVARFIQAALPQSLRPYSVKQPQDTYGR